MESRSWSRFFLPAAEVQQRTAASMSKYQEASTNLVYVINATPLKNYGEFKNILQAAYLSLALSLEASGDIPGNHDHYATLGSIHMDNVDYSKTETRNLIQLHIQQCNAMLMGGFAPAIFKLVELHRASLNSYFYRLNLPEQVIGQDTVIEGLRNPADAVTDLRNLIETYKVAISHNYILPKAGARLLLFLHSEFQQLFLLKINNIYPLMPENHGDFPRTLKEEFERIFNFLEKTYPGVATVMMPGLIPGQTFIKANLRL